MPKKINTTVLQTVLDRIALAETRIRALVFIMDGIPDYQRRESGSVYQYHSALHAVLYQQLNDAYRDLLMIGLLGKKAQREARKRAFEHYLKANNSIMHLLDLRGHHPGIFSADEEKEFRAEIEEAKKQTLAIDEIEERHERRERKKKK